jgi:ankyrin repeat protein
MEQTEHHSEKNDKYDPADSQFLTAASQGRLFLVKKYLQSYRSVPKVVDVNKQKILNKALYKAVQNGRTAVIHELLKAGSDPNNMPNLVIACQKGYTRILDSLLKYGANIHINNNKPLLEAIKNNNTGCVNILVVHGANIHIENDLPLIEACRKRNCSIVSTLVKNGADVDAQNGLPILESAASGFNDIIDILLQAGVDVNIENDLALKNAVKGNHILSMISLINAGADRSILEESTNLDQTTKTILDAFTKNNRLKRLKKAISDSVQKQDFKWQEYCTPSRSNTRNMQFDLDKLKLLREQSRLFQINSTNKTKRELCANFAIKMEQDMSMRPYFEQGVTDLSGTPINDLPYWKIMMIENNPFNVFDLIKLIQKGITLNPYTRNRLPIQEIKDAEIHLRRILTRTKYRNFNLLEQVSQLPILTDEIILRNMLQNQVWDRLLYSPPISIIMDATDEQLDNMLEKLRLVCKYRDTESLYDGRTDIYPMLTRQVCRKIEYNRDFAKKRDFVNLLSSIINHNDEHQDTRCLTVSIVMKHFHNLQLFGDELEEDDDDLTFMTDDYNEDEAAEQNTYNDWWNENTEENEDDE